VRTLTLAVTLAVMLAASCGGGGSSSQTVTVTQSAGSSALKAQSTPATTSLSSDQLQAYFDAITPIRAVLYADGAKLVTALEGIDSGQWPTSASIEAIARDYEKQAVQLSGVNPPPGLTAAHRTATDIATSYAAIFHHLAGDVSEKDKPAVLRDVTRLHSTGRKLTKWKVQMLAAAQSAGVTAPTWVKATGG